MHVRFTGDLKARVMDARREGGRDIEGMFLTDLNAFKNTQKKRMTEE